MIALAARLFFVARSDIIYEAYLVPALLRTLDRLTAPEGRVVLVQNVHRAATETFLLAAAELWSVTREPKSRLYEVWTLTRHQLCASGNPSS